MTHVWGGSDTHTAETTFVWVIQLDIAKSVAMCTDQWPLTTKQSRVRRKRVHCSSIPLPISTEWVYNWKQKTTHFAFDGNARNRRPAQAAWNQILIRRPGHISMEHWRIFITFSRGTRVRILPVSDTRRWQSLLCLWGCFIWLDCSLYNVHTNGA